MNSSKPKDHESLATRPFVAILIPFLACTVAICQAQQTRPFTVADEISLTFFGGPEGHPVDEFVGKGSVVLSPDSNYFAVRTERGHLDLNQVEDSLRFYRSQDVEAFLKGSNDAPPHPIWVVNRSGKKGPIIIEWRWLIDSSGVALLEHTAGDSQRLLLADLRRRTVEPLTSARETVGRFDIRDRQHYVYTAVDPIAARQATKAERQGPGLVGTGSSLFKLLFPNDSAYDNPLFGPDGSSYTLWVVLDGKRFEVKYNGASVVPIESRGGLYLALSPNGASVVTTSEVRNVPSSWENLYPPPYASSPYRIRAGQPASQYVLIDLQDGLVQPLTGGPTSNDGGWFTYSSPSWSSDGQAILLPGTFISSKDGVPSSPCVAVVDLRSKTSTCVEMFKSHNETGGEEGLFSRIKDARFIGGEQQRLIVVHDGSPYGTNAVSDQSSYSTIEYRHVADGEWEVADQFSGVPTWGNGALEVVVKQALNEPPRLVATNKQTSRVIWEPNPELKTKELGQVRVETWKDRDGRDWRAGLYLPNNYRPGHRYPLVIQTHGFTDSEFLPSGVYPTAFAARALAAVGIAVLQVREPCPVTSPNEGPCAVSGYEAATNKLVSEGLVDPEKIGIIGFSRTCFYVMETLTTSSLHIKAASITDGQMITYFQYMAWVGFDDDVPLQFDAVIGARPFGAGLQQWLKRSPGFNLDKITAPLSVVANGHFSLLTMWETYAGLRSLHKAVDLIVLNANEHFLTNPAARMASQGGTVDWFRFWLQDYEDSDPAKPEQYKRWRELRKLQEQNEKPEDKKPAATPTCK